MNSFQPETPFDVAVVGAGASGTLVAAQFKKLAPHGRLAIIGNSIHPARGVAYEAHYHSNLLNVRACNMSAFPNDPDHFVNWLKPRLPKSTPNTYAPRRFYGDYLTDIFYETISDMKGAEYILGTVINMSRNDEYWTILLEDGSCLEACNVVLAFGNLLPPSDPIDFSAVSLNYWRNPWTQNIALGLDEEAPVLLVGSGLTMVDVVLSLREVGHRGTIHSISRHGRLYQSHKLYQAWPLLNLPEEFKSPAGALRWIRREIKAAEKSGFDWRAVIDSLRPHTASIWQSWNQAQKASFLRHARNLWDTHRHRIAPEVTDQLGILLEDKELIIHRGKLISAVPRDQDATVSWIDVDTGETKSINVRRIINCTGPSRDYSNIQAGLISKLLTAKLVVPDALRLGFETDSDGRFIAQNGEFVQSLFTLGHVRIPALWELIAIPEIRNQALAIAEILVSETIEVNMLV